MQTTGASPGKVTGFLIINPSSGDERPSAEELRDAAAERGVTARILREGEDPAALAHGAGAEALGVAGGDGSLGAVAEVAIDRDLPFVCVPFGTRNHFARDLGLDRNDPIGALDAFTGSERRIDVGRVNERLFLNNVTLGLYAGLVHRRERRQRRRQALAGARALWLALRDRHPEAFVVDGQRLHARVLLVANNAYSLELLSIGERERIDTGRLHLYAANGVLPGSWDDWSGERFVIDSAERPLTAAVDGEAVELEPPLECAVETGRLRVLVPRQPG